MDPLATRFNSLAHKDLSLLEYVGEFSQLTVLTAFDNAVLKTLFWIGVNYHYPVDLPDTTGLSWREAIIQCLDSIYLRSGTQPDPVPSPPSLCCTGQQPEPTVNREPELAIVNQPLPHRLTEQQITTEPELQ
ncbi:hypothetical protein M9458_048526, partial [Cirrhinus mrigala]